MAETSSAVLLPRPWIYGLHKRLGISSPIWGIFSFWRGAMLHGLNLYLYKGLRVVAVKIVKN